MMRKIAVVTNITIITEPMKPVLPTNAALEEALIKTREGLALRTSDDECDIVEICDSVTVCFLETGWLWDFVVDAFAVCVAECVEL